MPKLVIQVGWPVMLWMFNDISPSLIVSAVIFWEMLSWPWYVRFMKSSMSRRHRSSAWVFGHSQGQTSQRCESRVQQKEEAQTNIPSCTHTQMLILQDLCKLVTGMARRSRGHDAMTPCVMVIFTNKIPFSMVSFPLSPISSSITRPMYYCRSLWWGSWAAVIISEYINVKLYKAFTALNLKALCLSETVSRGLLSKSSGLGGRAGLAKRRKRRRWIQPVIQISVV